MASLSNNAPTPETATCRPVRSTVAAVTPVSISHSAVEAPTLVDPVPQQPSPHLQLGVRQRNQLRRIEVLGRRGRDVRLGVGLQMPQQRQRPFDDNWLWRPNRAARRSAADVPCGNKRIDGCVAQRRVHDLVARPSRATGSAAITLAETPT